MLYLSTFLFWRLMLKIGLDKPVNVPYFTGRGARWSKSAVLGGWKERGTRAPPIVIKMITPRFNTETATLFTMDNLINILHRQGKQKRSYQTTQGGVWCIIVIPRLPARPPVKKVPTRYPPLHHALVDQGLISNLDQRGEENTNDHIELDQVSPQISAQNHNGQQQGHGMDHRESHEWRH